MASRSAVGRFHFLLPVIGLIALLNVAGCAAGRTIEAQPAEKQMFKSAKVIEEKTTVVVPTELLNAFKVSLDKKLFAPGVFTSGEGLTIKYRFVSYNGGSRMERWLTGGIGNAGEASTTVRVNFFDTGGKEIGNVDVEGHIGSGVFGGSVDDALDKATDQIVQYAIANFH